MSGQLRERYTTEVVPALQKQFEYRNPNEVPRLAKIGCHKSILNRLRRERQGPWSLHAHRIPSELGSGDRDADAGREEVL